MSAFSLGELKLRMSMKNFFTHHFLQKQITAFPDPSACAACLAFAIRKPDPQAVRMLLALGISANGHPLGLPGNQFAIKDDLSEIRPLGLSIKMMKLVGDEYPDLFRLHAQVAYLLIEADARLNEQCMSHYPFTVRDYAWSLSPEVLDDFEAAVEAREIRRATEHSASPSCARRI